MGFGFRGSVPAACVVVSVVNGSARRTANTIVLAP